MAAVLEGFALSTGYSGGRLAIITIWYEWGPVNDSIFPSANVSLKDNTSNQPKAPNGNKCPVVSGRGLWAQLTHFALA